MTGEVVDRNQTETGEVVDRNQVETSDKVVGNQTDPATSSEMFDAGVDEVALPLPSCQVPSVKDPSHYTCRKRSKKEPWSRSAEEFLRKAFKSYLYTRPATSVHNADIIMAQNTCPELSSRTMAQIRSKLNNMKLGKSK